MGNSIWLLRPLKTRKSQKSKEQEKKRVEKLEQQLSGLFKRWLKEDVGYIITSEEKKEFLRLKTSQDREVFIEQFWLRRDPTPDTFENEYQVEHYRRIAYANEKFDSGFPGWRTDRGRIYITVGPPDGIDDYTAGHRYIRPSEEGGEEVITFAFQIWWYRFLKGIGPNIRLEFVDKTMTGEYRYASDPDEKVVRRASNRPGVPRNVFRIMQDLFGRMKQFARLENWANLDKPPAVKFKDLEEVVESRIEYNTLPYNLETHYVRVTDNATLAAVTIQFNDQDLVFREEDGVSKSRVNIFGRVLTPEQRVATAFEQTLTTTAPPEGFDHQVKRSSIFQKVVSLAPGKYRLQLVIKDVIGETMGTHRGDLDLPQFEEGKLAASSLILADKIEKVSDLSSGSRQFVIGGSKVRPRMGREFGLGGEVGVYIQIYNLGENAETNRPQGSISYKIARVDNPDELFLDLTEDISDIPGATPRQTVVAKMLPLTGVTPGEHRLSVAVHDSVSNEVLTPSATFTVK